MEEELRPSQYKNEFYLGDMPGTLQYKKTPEELVTIETEPIAGYDYTNGYYLEEHSLANLERLIPKLKSCDGEWKLLLVIKKMFINVVILKGALLNKKTNQIGLFTSVNNDTYFMDEGFKTIETNDEKWVVGNVRMSAPMFFWNELKNRILF